MDIDFKKVGYVLVGIALLVIVGTYIAKPIGDKMKGAGQTIQSTNYSDIVNGK